MKVCWCLHDMREISHAGLEEKDGVVLVIFFFSSSWGILRMGTAAVYTYTHENTRHDAAFFILCRWLKEISSLGKKKRA